MKNLLILILLLAVPSLVQAENRRRQKNHGSGQGSGRQNARAQAPQAPAFPAVIYEGSATVEDSDALLAEMRKHGVVLSAAVLESNPPQVKFVYCATSQEGEVLALKYTTLDKKVDLAKPIEKSALPFAQGAREKLGSFPRTVRFKLKPGSVVTAEQKPSVEGPTLEPLADVADHLLRAARLTVLRANGQTVVWPAALPGDVAGEEEVRVRKFRKKLKEEFAAAGEISVQVADVCGLYALLDVFGQVKSSVTPDFGDFSKSLLPQLVEVDVH